MNQEDYIKESLSQVNWTPNRERSYKLMNRTSDKKGLMGKIRQQVEESPNGSKDLTLRVANLNRSVGSDPWSSKKAKFNRGPFERKL